MLMKLEVLWSMYKNKSFLAIIPARGGSKRLPGKNIKDLKGKPLIAWTIESALSSIYLDEVMVSTDDSEIAKVSTQFGAELPFIRPAELADDFSTRTDVIKHTITFYREKLGKNFDYLVYLQPTSPLRTKCHIDEAIEYLFCKSADAVVSVCEVEHPIQWSGILPEDNQMSNFLEKVSIASRSQDLKTGYRLNGAIYICDVEKFLEHNCIFINENIYAYKMSQESSVDIDSKLDFKFSEVLITERNNEN